MLTKEEIVNRIKRIQNGSGINKEYFPSAAIAQIAENLWYNPTFTYGMEYGYLAAMFDLLNGTDATDL